jgi:flagellar L-ring protein precursor FlgH
MNRVTVAIVAALVLGACANEPSHIDGYKPKSRDYQMPVQPEQAQGGRTDGSLWSANELSNYLYADQRALRVGDVLTVEVEEYADARRDANTRIDRKTEINANIASFLGAMAKLQKLDADIDPEELIAAGSEIDYESRGETGRSEQLTATVQVIVKKTLPNGNLFVEGHRVILVNDEEHHFYVSGVARPHDIDEQNEISSTKLADAEIEFTGRGVLSEQQKPGVFTRFFGWIWPF